jgi:hypothetical protein
MSRVKKTCLFRWKSGNLSTLEPITFLRIERIFKWNLRSDNQIFIFLPFLGLVLLRCELSFVAFSEFLRIIDRISKHSQNRQPKRHLHSLSEIICENLLSVFFFAQSNNGKETSLRRSERRESLEKKREQKKYCVILFLCTVKNNGRKFVGFCVEKIKFFCSFLMFLSLADFWFGLRLPDVPQENIFQINNKILQFLWNFYWSFQEIGP